MEKQMTYREIQKAKSEKELKEIDSYEANLKLHYESVKNELDTLIRSTIPLQMSLIKTVLWFNIVLFGLTLQIIKEFGVVYPFFATAAFLATCISISIALKAMIMGRKVHYGNYLKRTYMMSIPDDKWTKINGLHRMFYDVSRAVRYNGIVLIKRKRYIREAMLISVVSMIYFGILVSILLWELHVK
jgi:hypothetical protein